MKNLIGLLLFLCVGYGSVQAQSSAPAPADLARLFDYDVTAPLDVKEVSTRTIDGAQVKDITFASPKGGRVTAFLVTPVKGAGPRPAILYGHWGNGTRSEFLPEAILYARAGAVSLLIDYPWTRPAPWHKASFQLNQPETNRDTFIQAVVDLRRGLDLLAAQPEVDRNRIAYVGHSYGAQWGAILATVDKRPKTCVLVGGAPDYTAVILDPDDPDSVEFRRNTPKETLDKYMQTMSPLSAINYIGRAAPTSLFFQFATYEQYFNEAAMRRYFKAASEPKIEKWYPAGHDLNGFDTLTDRAEWLHKQIGVNALPVIAESLKTRR